MLKVIRYISIEIIFIRLFYYKLNSQKMNILCSLKCYASSKNFYISTVTKLIIMNEIYKHK